MISRAVICSPLLTRAKGEQLYLRVLRPLSTDLRPRAQSDSTEPFSTAGDSHNFHKPSNSQEDHNDADDGDDYDDDDDDVSLEFFAVHA